MIRDAAEQTIISVSGKVTAAGSVTAVGSGVTGQAVQFAAANPDVVSQAVVWADVGMMCGIVIGLAGFAVQSVSTYRRDKRERQQSEREKQMHQAQMAALQRDRS